MDYGSGTGAPNPNPSLNPKPNPNPNPNLNPSPSPSPNSSQARLQSIQLTNAALFWLLVSCVVGICISWAGFLCQSLVTATSYTVVGVMNKMLTVTARQPCRERIASAAPP